MNLRELNAREAEITAHYARKVKAAYEAKRTRRETRALIAEAMKERDDARGNMLRDFLRT